jgi:hypothetical protein
MRSLVYGNVLLFWLLIVGCSPGQTSVAPPNTSSGKPVSVEVFVFSPDHVYYAPTNIQIQAFVVMAGAQAGDSVTVDFFANSNKLGSVKSKWHEAIFPPNKPHQAQYMHVLPAGFDPMGIVWRKPQPGDYLLTAKASSAGGVPVVSQPLKITILPTP